ncbi:hypothetical protein Daus18300_010894 [Diaporthe australafricana]|uniref:Uncharacterized protein n=1 Tax=Diaporthe australafricana TaxID=127596 RepID=A0ABR3W8T2_9PEZI
MRFSYAIIALFGAAHAIPTVGSIVTERGVCNSAEDCKGVARAVVADNAALEARKKSKAAKGAAGNATAAAASNDNKKNKARSKELYDSKEARTLGDTVDGVVGEGTGLLDDVTGTVGLKTREGHEVRAPEPEPEPVTDNAALEARKKSKAAKGAAGNATAAAEARSVVTDNAALEARKKSKAAKGAAANATADAGAAAAKSRKSRKSRRSHQLY